MYLTPHVSASSPPRARYVPQGVLYTALNRGCRRFPEYPPSRAWQGIKRHPVGTGTFHPNSRVGHKYAFHSHGSFLGMPVLLVLPYWVTHTIGKHLRGLYPRGAWCSPRRKKGANGNIQWHEETPHSPPNGGWQFQPFRFVIDNRVILPRAEETLPSQRTSL